MRHFMAIFVIFALVLIALTQTTDANPGQEQHDVNSVADALQYLKELENKHLGRPRSRPLPFPRLENDVIEDRNSVNTLIYVLEQLDNFHSRTPRFGKRGNIDNLSKDYINYLRYYLENQPETYDN